MKKQVLSIVLSIIATTSFAQNMDLTWVNQISNTDQNGGKSVVMDHNDNIITVGMCRATVDLNSGVGVDNYTSAGSWDGFISKVDQNGNYLWGFGLGGAQGDGIYGVDVDAAGNIYITGIFTGTVNFNPFGAAYNLVSYSVYSIDAFWAKYDSNGNLLNAYSFGGAGYDQGNDIKVAPSGEIYIIGSFEQTVDFDPSGSVNNKTSNGASDIFITKFSTSYTLDYVIAMGSNNTTYFTDNGTAIDVNPTDGSVIASGFFEGTMNMNPNGITVNRSSWSGSRDGFIGKYNSSGVLVWGYAIGSGGFDVISDCTLDTNGDVYITGEFKYTTNFNPGGTPNYLSATGSNSDIFISKYSATGFNTLAFRLGTVQGEAGTSLTTNNNVLFLGGYYMGSLFDANPAGGNILPSSSGNRGFFAAYDMSGNHLASGAIEGLGVTYSYGIDANSDNYFVITGEFSGTQDFDVGAGVQNITSPGNKDVFTAKYKVCINATGTDTRAECSQITWLDGNTYSYNNNTATYTYVGGAASGCDSVVTLNFTRLYPKQGTDTQIACNSYLWIDGNTYTSTNTTAKDTLVGAAANGCDSIVTLNLMILNSATGTDLQTACNSYLWTDGNTYTANNNTAKDTIVGGAFNGCDSIVTLNLTILNSATGTDVQTACNSYLWTDGNTYTSNNITVKDTLVGAAANGCDSIVTLNLTIFNTITSTDTRTECSPFVWIDGNTYTTNNTTAKDTIVGGSFNGCDSIVTLNLTILNSTTGTDVQTACNSYLWTDGNTYTANNTTAKDTIVGGAFNGCDSIVTLNLTILNNATGTDVQTACNSYLWADGNTYTANNTTAKDTLIGAAANGCDSIVTLNLTILNSATGTDVQTACNSYLWTDGNTYTSNNTTAKDTIIGGSVNGCDSIVTLNLTILNSAIGTDVQTACNSFLWIDGNTYTANNTTAKDTIVGGAANGCDSIVTLNLTIFNGNVTGTDTRTECSPFVWIDGNTYTTNNTTAKDTLVAGAANGCDSIVTLNLTITTVDTSVTQAGTNLSANELVATYQWLDCDNNYAVIPGETFRTYYVLADGNYAVEVTYYGCVDTSSCYNVIVSSVAENTVNNNITIYPNPVKDQLTITTKNEKITSIKIINVTGKTIKVFTENITTINVADLPKGLYLLQIQTEKGMSVKRFIKE